MASRTNDIEFCFSTSDRDSIVALFFFCLPDRRALLKILFTTPNFCINVRNQRDSSTSVTIVANQREQPNQQSTVCSSLQWLLLLNQNQQKESCHCKSATPGKSVAKPAQILRYYRYNALYSWHGLAAGSPKEDDNRADASSSSIGD